MLVDAALAVCGFTQETRGIVATQTDGGAGIESSSFLIIPGGQHLLSWKNGV